MGWDLLIDVGAGTGALPMFLGIARAIADDVRRGRLKPGEALPGTRTLATSLGVHRNTVVAAYHELEAEGWITSAAQRGTFVSRELPEPLPRARVAAARRSERPGRVGFDLAPWQPTPGWEPRPPPAVGSSGVLPMVGGTPDVRLVPVAELARAYRRALRSRAVLSYADPAGHPRLRGALAAMLSRTRGLAVPPDGLVVTRGSQMALYLVARALVRPGDVVAVEALGYRNAHEAFRRAGARLVPVRVDAQGLDVSALAALHQRERVRAVYVTPHHQYPTTATLSAGRRLALLQWARAERICVVEDDYDHEFHYDGRPVLPMASADRAGVVVYVGTLSKVLAPGLRIGYVAAPAELVSRLVEQRAFVDGQGDHAMEHAVAALIEDGELARHVRRARRVYRARRDALLAALDRRLGGVLTWRVPPGGMALWAHARGVDVDAWADRALAGGVAVQPARKFAFDGRSRPYLRLGFACLDEPQLAEAVRRLSAKL